MKKLILLGAILAIGASSYAALESLTPSGEAPNQKWSGGADLKMRATGVVKDLEGKFGILLQPTKGGTGGDFIIEFGNVAKGQTTDFVENDFVANVVQNAAENGGLYKFKLKGKNNSDQPVATTLDVKFVTRNGEEETDADDTITSTGKMMVSRLYTTVNGSQKEIGAVEHQVAAGINANTYDYEGTVKSKLAVANDAPAGSFAGDVGRIRVTVTDFEQVKGDTGELFENRGA